MATESRQCREKEGNALEKAPLPIDAFEGQIVKTVQENSVVVIAAETGAGKSTKVPLMLLKAGFGAQGQIGITQPRRVAVMTVSEWVAELHGTPLGETIGYQIGGERKLSRETRVKFMTDGILLRELHSDPELRRYEVVIVDEAHERGVNQDLILALLKRLRARRPDMKIIIMSATIDEKRFSDFFGGAPIIKVPGRVFPVDIRYGTETPTQREMPKTMACAIADMIRGGERGDILGFLPDEQTIKKCCDELDAESLENVRVLPLYGSQAPDEQRAVFARDDKQRIIIATNIAETSVTIDGITVVVDSCLIKQVVYVSASMSALRVTDHSRAGCDQRAGRAGRTRPGTCLRLSTKDDFDDRPSYTEPEIRRMSLDQILLNLRVLEYTLGEVKSFEFMDPPGDARWDEAHDRLKLLGALDKDGTVTEDGLRMNRLPVAPVFGRMLLAAEVYGCLNELATIVAGLIARTVFVRPRGKDKEADAAHLRFKSPLSDCLTILKVFGAWLTAGENGKRNVWARDNFLSSKALREIERNREQILDVLYAEKMLVVSSSDETIIRKAVAAGLIVNLCTKAGRFNYSAHGRDDVFIYPGSSLFGAGPKTMVAAELYESTTEKGTKLYARTCTAIDEKWIMELVPADACVRTITIERGGVWRDGPLEAIEKISWQGTVIREERITTLTTRHIATIATLILLETVRPHRTAIHPKTEMNRALWGVIAAAKDIMISSWSSETLNELVNKYPILIKIGAYFAKCMGAAKTLDEVLTADITLALEDWLSPEEIAAHQAAVEAATIRRERAAAEWDERQRERETAYAAEQREWEETRAPLRTQIRELKTRLEALSGPEAASLLSQLNWAEMDMRWSTPDRTRDQVHSIRVRTEEIERKQAHRQGATRQIWDTVLAAFPACPLCGGAWQEVSSQALRCQEVHDLNRVIALGDEGRAGVLSHFKTDRDETAARIEIVHGGAVMVLFEFGRTEAWPQKKFKSVRQEVEAAVLPASLMGQRKQILDDLAALRQAREELQAVMDRVKEAEKKVGAGAMRTLTFKVVGGEAVAEEGGMRYRSAYQDPYPQAGETWFCRVGRNLGGTIEVHPEFKAGSVASTKDLDELTKLIQETYPGLPPQLLFLQ